MMESTGCPVRSFMDDQEIKWLHGKPDYSAVNKKYLEEKSQNHKDGSLEKIVENLVKTWEMESSHKIDAKDWSTVDRDKFRISSNGGKKFTLQDNIEIGNYNMLLVDCPLYETASESNESSHKLFRQAFPNGFAWEVMKVFSGPPDVAFTWRHWGTWEGKYQENQPTREKIELTGSCVATVGEDLKIQEIQVFYDPNPMIAKLSGFRRTPSKT